VSFFGVWATPKGLQRDFSFSFQIGAAGVLIFLATVLDAASAVSDNRTMISPGIIVPMVTPSVV
jgi:hypothetical protein